MWGVPTISFRVSEDGLAELQAAASVRRCSVSEFVRVSLGLAGALEDERFEEWERRLCRLEELAGL